MPNAYQLALDLLSYSGIARLLQSRCAGVGALLTLHHVRPAAQLRPFAPNRILEITPEFLEAAILELRAMGYEFVSLDEFHDRMTSGQFGARFVSFTIDDGYVDNYTYAFPIFKKYDIPFAIYVCTGIMDGTAQLWWRELESIVGNSSLIRFRIDGEETSYRTESIKAKFAAFKDIYWKLRAAPLATQLDAMALLRRDHQCSVDPADAEPLTWQMISEMMESGLLTVGGHTVSHYALSKLGDTELRDEIEAGCRVIREHTGTWPAHFAYPYGDRLSADKREFATARDLGFATAVTTRKGMIVAEQATQLFGIPRISMNGDYQRLRYLKTLMTGVPTALFQRLKSGEVTY